MNQASGNGVGGTDMPPSSQHEQMQDAVDLSAGVDPKLATLRNFTREKISNYIESKQSMDNLGGMMLPMLVRQLEEIMFKMHRCKTGYYNMAEGEFEPDLQIAIEYWRGQNQQNEQLSRLLQPFPFLGTMFDTPPSFTQGESGNPGMYPYVTANMGIVSSPTGMVLPQSGNMGTSLPGKDPDKHVNDLISLGMNRRPKRKVMQANEVPREPKFSCPICMNELVDASSTICGHLFCEKCIKASIQAQSKCPTCRRKLNMKNFHRVYFPTTD